MKPTDPIEGVLISGWINTEVEGSSTPHGSKSANLNGCDSATEGTMSADAPPLRKSRQSIDHSACSICSGSRR
jgi:hypothetical protein